MSTAEPHSGERHRQYCFGGFTLDLDAGLLRRGDEDVALRPKSFEVLAFLVQRHGRLVTREELMRAVWPDVAVTDEAVTKCIADIRRAVEKDAPELIRTLARRGYMLTAPVTTPAVEFPLPAEHRPIPIAPMNRSAPPEEVPLDDGAPRPWRARLSTPWAVGLAALLIASGLAFFAAMRATRRGETGSAAWDYTALTNFTNAAFSPALSPDGRMLTFIRGEMLATIGGEGDIFVKFLPDGEPVQLTHDGKAKMSPSFSPTGDRIVYGIPTRMMNPTGWTTWTVAVFGGEPRLLLSNASALAWIPGVSPPKVLFSEVDRGTHMSIVTSAENRAEARTVYSPAGADGMAHRSFLSPDRKYVLVVEMDGRGWGPCRLVPFEGGSQTEHAGRLVGPSPGQCSSAAWSPGGKWMYLSVNTGNGYHIFRQRFSGGQPEQVTFGATEERDIAFAADGRSFLTSVGTQQSTLWIHDARGERQITSEGYASLPKFSPDGRNLYYLLRSHSNRRYVSGELWAANLETGQRQRLLPEFLLADYDISSDGGRVLFLAIGDQGETSVWLAGLDARSAPRRITVADASRVFFGAPGEILFSSREKEGKGFFYRVREDGSGLQKASPDPVIYVYDVSPDKKAFAAWPKTFVQVFPADGGPPVDVNALCAAAGGENRGITPPCVKWSPNGKFLYLYDRIAGQIYTLAVPPGRTLPDLPAGGISSARQATSLPGTQVIRERHAFVGPDPSVYAFFRIREQRNIYRIRVP